MAVNYCGGVVPDARADGPLVDAAATAFERQSATRWTRLDFSCGFGAVWDLIRAANAFIEDRAAVGAATRRATRPRSPRVLGDCLEALRIVALLASPVIPNAAAELWRRLGLPGRPEDAAAARGGGLGAAARGRDAREGRAAVPARREA